MFDESNVWLNSPLVLIPVIIDGNSQHNTYYISEYEDEYTTNPALLYKLKSEYELDLPIFRGEGFEEENLLDYYDNMRKCYQEFSVDNQEICIYLLDYQFELLDLLPMNNLLQ